MFKIILLTVVTFFSNAVMSCPTTLCKTETELKINLTKEGFAGLKKVFLKKFNGEESERTDYYFDIFQNNQYYLKNILPPIKLRYMWDGSHLSWQTQKIVKSDTHSIFSIKTTDAISMDVKHDKTKLEEIDNYLTHLDQLDPYALTIAESIQRSLVNEKIIQFSNTLCSMCTNDEKYFATHTNSKKRVKIKLKIDDDQFTVQLGATNNRGITTYELEAEVKKSDDLYKSADRLNNWLESIGFTASQIEVTIQTDPTAISAEELNKLFVFGV